MCATTSGSGEAMPSSAIPISLPLSISLPVLSVVKWSWSGHHNTNPHDQFWRVVESLTSTSISLWSCFPLALPGCMGGPSYNQSTAALLLQWPEQRNKQHCECKYGTAYGEPMHPGYIIITLFMLFGMSMGHIGGHICSLYGSYVDVIHPPSLIC